MTSMKQPPIIDLFTLPSGYVPDSVALGTLEELIISTFDTTCKKFSNVARTLDDKWYKFVDRVAAEVSCSCKRFIGRPVIRLK